MDDGDTKQWGDSKRGRPRLPLSPPRRSGCWGCSKISNINSRFKCGKYRVCKMNNVSYFVYALRDTGSVGNNRSCLLRYRCPLWIDRDVLQSWYPFTCIVQKHVLMYLRVTFSQGDSPTHTWWFTGAPGGRWGVWRWRWILSRGPQGGQKVSTPRAHHSRPRREI